MEHLRKASFAVENFFLINLICGTIELTILGGYFFISLYKRFIVLGDQYYEFATIVGFSFAILVASAAIKKYEIRIGFLALCIATVLLLAFFWGVEVKAFEVTTPSIDHAHLRDYLFGLLPIFLFMTWHGLFWAAFATSTLDQEIADISEGR
jgi:hypothetical protein